LNRKNDRIVPDHGLSTLDSRLGMVTFNRYHHHVFTTHIFYFGGNGDFRMGSLAIGPLQPQPFFIDETNPLFQHFNQGHVEPFFQKKTAEDGSQYTGTDDGYFNVMVSIRVYRGRPFL